MTMKENPNATLYDSNFSSKEEIHPLNGVRRETDFLVCEDKERDKCWNPKFVDDFSMDNQNGTRNSTEKEFQNGLFYPPSSLNEDADSLSSDTNPKPSTTPQRERSMTVAEIPSFNENQLKDSNFYTDKNVLECDTPELMVCYKDINYHVVKDICVDEGLPVNGSAEDSFVDRTLPIQEFGEGNKVLAQVPHQVSGVSAGPDTSSDEAGPNGDVKASSLSYNSKIESKSITFNFNSPAPETAGISNGKTENVNEQYVDSTNVLDHKNTDSSQVHCNSIKNTSFEKVDDQLLPHHKDENNSHDFDTHVLKVDDESVVSQEKYEQGESSFSAAGFIAHSGPIAFSGSISFRSDGSATSGRSFAFPILQSEWNNSPVRMTKADGRHFRKHKCWRSGLLCCRF